MTEQQLQDALIEAARVLGYLTAHFRPALTEKGWRTPMQGDPGFPDLVLAGRGRLIHAELKSARGRLTYGQRLWIAALEDAGQEVYVWRPADWLDGSVVRLLQHERTDA